MFSVIVCLVFHEVPLYCFLSFPTPQKYEKYVITTILYILALFGVKINTLIEKS